MDFTTWLAFFAASWAISISPGAGAVAAMSAGLQHGFARGYWLTLGLVLGIWTQVMIVGLGLGALIAASSLAFAVIKWLGVAYLLWIGIALWRAPAAPLVADAAQARGAATRRALVLRGWAINSVNPKGTLFMLAVMPQFIVLQQPLLPQYLVIAATLALTDFVVMAAYTALAARLLSALREPHHVRALNRVFGSLFIALAATLATVRRAG
jgi:homoserine/homoserine lactone efflux protein